MDVIKLRVLTPKSIFKFGPYKGQSVGVIVKRSPNYIVNAYYNLSAISFNNEILEELGIVGEFVIDKPSKDKSLAKKFYKNKYKAERASRSDLENIKEAAKYKKDKKFSNMRRRISYNNYNNKLLSKSNLQGINHGR